MAPNSTAGERALVLKTICVFYYSSITLNKSIYALQRLAWLPVFN